MRIGAPGRDSGYYADVPWSEVLLNVVKPRLPDPAAAWFSAAVETVRSTDAVQLGRLWSGAGRRLGRAPLRLSNDEVQTVAASGLPVQLETWAIDEVGRVILLLVALESTPDRAATVAEDLFATGEVRERSAVLRALPLLPDGGALVPLAAEAVRSNILSDLEALGCESPFPSAHMPDPAFNQMIMKMLFNGVALSRVVGLEKRRNAELARMAVGWVSERRAAGRPIPEDVNLIVGA